MFDEATQKELFTEFLLENQGALQAVESDLLRLELAPRDRDLINTIFRNMHTVKGNCRMMEFGRLEELTHEAENLLDHLREGRLNVDQPLCNILLRVVDAVRGTLGHIERHGDEGDANFVEVIDQLRAVCNTIDVTWMMRDAPAALPPGEAEEELDLGPTGNDAESPGALLQTVQLSTTRLDLLLDLAGELGATFNQLRYAFVRDRELAGRALEMMEQQLLNLQEEVMQYRLQPIGRMWDSYHRLVRDLAVATGKKVLLDLSGEETEVDRNILNSLRESLGHLIRNAIDHGIESPTQRVALGKAPVGRVRLSATQKHGQIYLEIGDDGQGIPVERVLAKALEKGVLTPAEGESLAREEILKLILRPGFSTTDQVSRISGRGAGMDVVKSAVEKVGGSIQILTGAGQGTTFRLRIPQTVSIVPTLLVRSGDERYALPQAHVVELVSYYGAEVAQHLERKLRQPMVRVRQRLLPMLMLGEVLASGASQPKEELHVVVVQSDEQPFAVAVDGIDEPVSLLIKPLPRCLSQVALLGGAAVMPNGTVSFLLDIPELFRCLAGKAGA